MSASSPVASLATNVAYFFRYKGKGMKINLELEVHGISIRCV